MKNAQTITVTPLISISENEIKESFIRSSGAGGQKVNKTETCVQLRFDARHCKSLSNSLFLRLKALSGRLMTQNGIIVITANIYRTQEQNRKNARARLVAMIAEAAIPPKFRHPTKPSKNAKTKRTDKKKLRGEIKKGRGSVSQAEF